ncbi:MAG: hypothetical protein LBS62_04505 [Clostridiales bacterium]|jgi:hypothetical protein|nr:hypothetical protein [Clostridiales bacterium]
MSDKMIVLQNAAVRVVIDCESELYRGGRFDRQGLIASFRRGPAEFCGAEGEGGGVGLCNEFGLADPVGFEDAQQGGLFLKIGVGWLQKTTDQYRQVYPYPIAELVRSQYTRLDGAVRCGFDSGEENGYAVRCSKTYTLTEDGVSVAFSLENTGSKAIATSEYCHNFLTVNGTGGLPVDSKYSLQTGCEPIDRAVRDLIAGGQPVYYAAFDRAALPDSFREWRFSHEDSPVMFRESCDFHPVRFAVWGTRAVISAECFHALRLLPGERAVWSRTYYLLERV